MEVRRLLKEQLLRRFLELSGNIYPDLVRVFYTNLQFNGDILVSHVKGVDLEITNEVWTTVTGLKFSGLRINRGTGVVDEFNKMQFYKNCLKNPQARVTKFGVRGLKLNERLVALIVSWILTPRGSNHSTLSEEDLVLICCIMNKIKLNWIHIIKDHMQKATRLCDFCYPYSILITKFLQYFEVDLEEELAEVVKSSSEVNSGSLSKMGFTKINGFWVSKDGDPAASSSVVQAEDEDEDVEEPVAAENARPSADIGEERITSMKSFERLVINKMDNLAEN